MRLYHYEFFGLAVTVPEETVLFYITTQPISYEESEPWITMEA